MSWHRPTNSSSASHIKHLWKIGKVTEKTLKLHRNKTTKVTETKIKKRCLVFIYTVKLDVIKEMH